MRKMAASACSRITHPLKECHFGQNDFKQAPGRSEIES